MELGVNIDHAATLRQARYRGGEHTHNAEPDVIAIAIECEKAGAHGITAHLREDRRHIQDDDIRRLRDSITTKLNFEMGNAAEIVDIALDLKPDDVCLVPENREEITTEGGLDVVAHFTALQSTVSRMADAGITVSMFIDPDPAQIDATVALGAPVIELHTGAFANTQNSAHQHEFTRLKTATAYALDRGLQVNAGHGINYQNIHEIRTIDGLSELNIGHSIICRALFTGIEKAVKDMLLLMHSTTS